MIEEYKNYFIERGIPFKNYRAYEIEKFMLFVKYKKLSSLDHTDFERFIQTRKKEVSGATLDKISSVITCFIIWTAKKTKNYNLLTDALFNKLLMPKIQKKKKCKDLST